MIIHYIYIAISCAFALAYTNQGTHDSRPKSLDVSSACTRKYKIVAGDTCDKISAKQGVSTHQLAQVNKKINGGCTNLAIGDTLCLGLKGQDCTHVYVVKESDICFSVAKKAGIPLDVLFKNNPNINKGCTNIYPGEVLCVSPTVKTTEPTSVGGIKGVSGPPAFPLHNSTHNATIGNGPFGLPPVNLTGSSAHLPGNPNREGPPFLLPPVNLTDTIGHVPNFTHKGFNASSIPLFLNTTGFPAFNQTSQPLGMPNLTIPPPLHTNHTRNGSFPLNLTSSDSPHSPPSAIGDDIHLTLNPSPTLSPDEGFTLPTFVPSLPTRISGDLHTFANAIPTSATPDFDMGAGPMAIPGDGPFGGALKDSPFPFPTTASDDSSFPSMPL